MSSGNFFHIRQIQAYNETERGEDYEKRTSEGQRLDIYLLHRFALGGDDDTFVDARSKTSGKRCDPDTGTGYSVAGHTRTVVCLRRGTDGHKMQGENALAMRLVCNCIFPDCCHPERTFAKRTVLQDRSNGDRDLCFRSFAGHHFRGEKEGLQIIYRSSLF